MKDGLTNSNSNYAMSFLRRAVIIFLILALILFAGFTVLFVVYDVKSINSILYVFVLQNIMWLFGILSVVLASFFAIIFIKQMNSDESVHEETLQAPPENSENPERDKALYDEIIHFIKKNKSFKNPNFNAHSLAIALNTNVTYISKAISRSDSDNFNMLLNEFRINYVKSMLDNGALKKYTIDYIYAEAGYKHRSTFNAAFKSITGMTPSEYASLLNPDDNQDL